MGNDELKNEEKVAGGLGDKIQGILDKTDIDEKIAKSAGNIPTVQTSQVGTLNVYDVVNNGTLVVTKDAVEKIQEVYA